MKIGFDAKRLFLNKTGLGNYSRTLVRNLQHCHPEHQYYLYTPKVEVNDSTQYFLAEDKFTIRTCSSWYSSYWRSKGVVKDLKRDGIDIYHGLSHEIPWGTNKAGIKTCVTVHDLIFEIYPALFNPVDRFIYQFKYKNSAQRANRVIAISESTSLDIQSRWDIDEDSIDIVYQSVGPDFYLPSSRDNEGKEHFLYVGSVIERKGLLDIIHAYGQLRGQRKLPPFVVIGGGKRYMDQCKAEIRKQGLNDQFEFVGEVDNEKLIQYYDRAVALIYPSQYEGFGIPIVEAMLRKTPVICSNTSSMPEAGGPYSIYVTPGNIDEIINAMNYCLDNINTLPNQVENSFLYAKDKFSAKIAAKTLHKIYQDLMNGGSVS